MSKRALVSLDLQGGFRKRKGKKRERPKWGDSVGSLVLQPAGRSSVSGVEVASTARKDDRKTKVIAFQARSLSPGRSRRR